MISIPPELDGLAFKPLGYIDSIYVRSPKSISFSMRQRIRAYVKHGLIGKVYFGRLKGKYSSEVVIGFHQPSPGLIPILDAIVEQEGWQLLSVHVALDLLVKSRREARRIADSVTRRLVQRHRPAEKQVVRYRSSLYYSHRTAGRNVTIYADRKSKCADRHCCHIELRLRRIANLRRVGIRRVSDILGCDFRHVFRKVIALEEPDLRTLGRIARGRKHAKKPLISVYSGIEYDHDLRTGQIILHAWAASATASLSKFPVATLVRSACKFHGIRPERVLRRLDSGLLLPLPLIIEKISPTAPPASHPAIVDGIIPTPTSSLTGNGIM